MQKVLRRAVMAEKQVARRKHKKGEINAKIRRANQREQNQYIRGQDSQLRRQERIKRREDWELGPLAPKRDAGDAKDTYGAVDPVQLRGEELDVRQKHELLRKLKEQYQTIVVGDRVVLLEGRDKGKIGIVQAKDVSRGEVKVRDLNMVDVAVPKWMITDQSADQIPVRSVEKPVPILSVRLVHPIKDKTTGETKDMIITRLIKSKSRYYDKTTNTASWYRIIPGLDIRIPWPKKKLNEYKEYPDDTLRLEVESRSFVPTFLTPPMPGSVINELRNKYSIFRTRHDSEYIEKKMQEDRETEGKKKMMKRMRTPLHDIRRKERKLRRAQGKGTLTNGMMERIGKIIAEKRQLLFDSAGMSKEGAVSETIV